MKVAVGSDHAGLELKAAVLEELRARGAEIADCGAQEPAACDYPDYAGKVAALVAAGEADRGVLICGTGMGMCMAANRFRGVRAAVAQDELHADLSRRHNDANVLCLGGRVTDAGPARRLLSVWLDTPFDGGRHLERVQKLDRLGGGQEEKKG